MKSPLKNKWVLITGASSGFGAAAARAFGAEGAKLLLGARRVERLKKVAAESLQAGAAAAQAHELDVTKTASVEAFIAWAKSKIQGKPDGSARSDQQRRRRARVGHRRQGQGRGLGDDDADECAWRVPRDPRGAAAHAARCGPSIINIGSIAGHTAYEGGAVYCAAKAGELQITRALRIELNGTGIRVGTVDPGLAETEFSLVRFKGDAERAKKVYAGIQPLTAEDMAEILVWVASRPPHVNIDEMLVKPVDQAAIHKIYRRKKGYLQIPRFARHSSTAPTA